jgi:hypothetical protein
LAIEYSKAAGKPLRTRDSGWLETLFIALARRSGFEPSSGIAIEPDERQLRVLQSLLEVASAEKLHLGAVTLGGLASKSCGFVSHELLVVKWSIISYMFDIDPDTFTGSIGKSYTILVQDTGDKITLLESLIRDLRFESSNSHSSDSVDIYSEQRKVAKQMLSAFAQARNIIGFLEIWQRELSLHIEVIMASTDDEFMDNFPNSVWLESNLADTLKDVLESALIPRQIEAFLEQLLTQIDSKDSNKNTNGAVRYATLILMDMIVKSIRTEQIQETVFETVLICYGKLSQDLESWSQRCRSRLWSLLRSLGTICFNVKGHMPFKKSDDLLIEARKAAMTLDTDVPTSKRAIGYSEAYQAFGFISSVHVQSGQPEKDKAMSFLEEIMKIVSTQIEARDIISGRSKTSNRSIDSENVTLFSRSHECWKKGSSITGMITALLMEYLTVFMQGSHRPDVSPKLTLNLEI